MGGGGSGGGEGGAGRGGVRHASPEQLFQSCYLLGSRVVAILERIISVHSPCRLSNEQEQTELSASFSYLLELRCF